MSCTKHAPKHCRALMWVLIKAWVEEDTVCVCVCLSIREATWPRQHVTLPTGVAETKFDEDPEAEEAAVASAQGAGSSTPAFKGAPDRNSSTAPDALEGVCSASYAGGHNPPCFYLPFMTLDSAAACVHASMVFCPLCVLVKQVGRGTSAWMSAAAQCVEFSCTVLNNLQSVCTSCRTSALLPHIRCKGSKNTPRRSSS